MDAKGNEALKKLLQISSEYGERLCIPSMDFQDLLVDGQTSVADALVYTKMCPQLVRLVVKGCLTHKKIIRYI